jgi:UDP-N-acetylmuramoyl-L-alanyl-D-glutamate--2,6-diaminopimelate ligase
VEPDRIRAIHLCLERGRPGDVIVLAGKGHETYQEIMGVRYPMDEREVVREYFQNKSLKYAEKQHHADGKISAGMVK